MRTQVRSNQALVQGMCTQVRSRVEPSYKTFAHSCVQERYYWRVCVCVFRQALREGAMMSLQPLDNPLASSVNSVAGYGYTSLLSGLPQLPSMMPSLHPAANLVSFNILVSV